MCGGAVALDDSDVGKEGKHSVHRCSSSQATYVIRVFNSNHDFYFAVAELNKPI
jgi:hypothetical protein